MKRIFTFLLVSLWGINYLLAQFTFTNHTPIQSWKFYYDLNQDIQGNIWVAAQDGIILKYDGSTWTEINPPNFGDENMRAVGAVNDNDIWVGTQNLGLLHFDGTTWTEFNTSNSMLPHNRIRTIRIADNGDVWVATSSGFVVINGGTWTVYTSSNSDLPDGKVTDIEFDSSGNTWLANDNYIVRINGNTWTSWLADDVTNIFGTETVDLDIASNGDVYVGTGRGLLFFDGTTWSPTVYVDDFSTDDFNIQAVAIDNNDMVWFSTINFGIYIHDIPTNTQIGAFENDGQAVPSGQILAIIVDPSNTIWLAGIGGGIAEITDVAFTIPLTLMTEQTDVLCNGESNGTIVLSPNGGVPPYSYTWSDNTLSGSMLTGLASGSYDVTVSDSDTFSIIETITIIEPSILAATLVSNPEVNTNADGSLSITVDGGVSPYTYLWSDGQTTSEAINLSTGNYTVNVTDANQCTFETTGFVDMVTDVNMITDEVKILITPNPILETLNLNFEGISEELELAIFSLGGKILLQKNLLSGGTHSIDVTSFSSGLYFVRIIDKYGSVYTQKIIIR